MSNVGVGCDAADPAAQVTPRTVAELKRESN